MKNRKFVRSIAMIGTLLFIFTGFVGCKKEATIPGEPCYIDLHLHIDGAMSVDTAIVLAEMESITLPTTNREELKNLLTVSENCRDLNEYLEKFDLPCSLMQTKATISEMVYRLQEELKQSGVIYAEMRFAPQKHTDKGLSQEEVVLAAIEGLNRSDLDSNLILCCMRGEGLTEENKETVRLADIYRNQGVVAVDLAGAEALFPTSDYEDIFNYARQLNVKAIIHAGEASGPESVKKAISFGAKRIGHGVRSYEDDELMELLTKEQIPLELCVTSNLQTKAIEEIEQYPIRKFMEKGIIVTLNTDNPVVSGTNMKKELELAVNSFQLTKSELHTIIKNSVKVSFASESVKQKLNGKIDSAFNY